MIRHVVSISAVLVFALPSGSAMAGSSASCCPVESGISTGGGGSGSSHYVNTDSRTATDFHFTYRINPNDDASNWHFVSHTVGTSPVGTISETPILKDGFEVGYDIDVTGLGIPQGGGIDIEVSGVLSASGNWADFSNIRWTYLTFPNSVSTAADWRFAYPGVLVTSAPHPTSFTLTNIDASRLISFSKIYFRWDRWWYPPGERVSPSAAFDSTGTFTLSPGDSMTIPLSVPSLAGAQSFIYASGSMTYTGTGGGTPVSFNIGHEENNEVLTGVDLATKVDFALRVVTPNPTQQDLRVSFGLPDAQPARIDVFNVSGRRVATQEVGSLGPGLHTVTLGERTTLPSGVYLFRLTQGDKSQTARAILVH